MMRYRLEVYSIWELGSREKQEDSIYPEYGKEKESDRLFILCDGMGGHSAGEIASSTVCQAISQSIFNHSSENDVFFTDEIFKIALNDAFDALDTKDDGATKKMGTTIAFLKLHEKGATIAHIGDSRIYHIRPGKKVEDTKILFQTQDHSLINDLIKIGELTQEEAKHSKQKNIITRAMQPCMEYRSKADLFHIEHILPGDYFMLCSDGILEELEEENIRFIFSHKGGSARNKANTLKKVTEHNRDNHSAILVHILDVKNNIDNSVNIVPKKNNPVTRQENKTDIQSSERTIVYFLVAILMGGAYIICKYLGLI